MKSKERLNEEKRLNDLAKSIGISVQELKKLEEIERNGKVIGKTDFKGQTISEWRESRLKSAGFQYVTVPFEIK
jgi:hypothetical protein